jgi:hypothetical protein
MEEGHPVPPYQQPKLNSGLDVFIEFPYLVRLSQDIDWPVIGRYQPPMLSA